MKRTCKNRDAGSRLRWRWQPSREPARLANAFGVHPNQIYNWKKRLLDGAASVFEGGGAAAQGTASEAQVDLLYRRIGQLRVENDFLVRNPRP
jgi:transposase-like protein